MNTQYQSCIALTGRVLLGTIFLVAGAGKVINYSGTLDHMTQHGIPAASIALPIAIAIEILGALCLLVGWQTRIAAAVLFLFLIPTTLTFHNFWAFPPAEQQMQMIQFLKNLAIMGGLLSFNAFGAGAYSLDALFAQKTTGAWSITPSSTEAAAHP